jgi:hypothetical protein
LAKARLSRLVDLRRREVGVHAYNITTEHQQVASGATMRTRPADDPSPRTFAFNSWSSLSALVGEDRDRQRRARQRDQHLDGTASVIDPTQVGQTALREVVVVRGGCSWCSGRGPGSFPVKAPWL